MVNFVMVSGVQANTHTYFKALCHMKFFNFSLPPHPVLPVTSLIKGKTLVKINIKYMTFIFTLDRTCVLSL